MTAELVSPQSKAFDRPATALVAIPFFASGFSALVYQVAWQRILALHTGVGTYSIALIVAAFMAGLGIGSHVGGVLSERLSARQALLGFGVLEIAIALLGTASVPFYYDFLYVRGHGLYGSPLAAGVLHFVSLLPPTALMGASLPFLSRALVEDGATAGRTIGVLYGINMLGAAAGALLAPWWALRYLGIHGGVLLAAAINALAGATALLLVRGGTGAGVKDERDTTGDASADIGEARQPLPFWLGLYAMSGFCALSLEILWFRLLDVSTRSTAFTFGTLLAVYLFGTAAGCLVGARRASTLERPLRVFLLCQCGLLGYAALAVIALVALPDGLPGLSWLHAYWRTGTMFHLGNTWNLTAILALYVILPGLLFGPSTFLMGLSFPALQRAVQDDPVTCGRRVGLLQAANIVGCVAGSLAVGVVGLDHVGTSGCFAVLLVAGIGFAAVGWRVGGARTAFGSAAAALAVLAVFLPSNDRLWLRLNGATSPSAMAAEDATSVAAILPKLNGWYVAVNGKYHSWLPFGGIHTRLGAVPAIIHPAPIDIAIIGLGSGDTAWAASCRRETRSITVFEIAAPQRALLGRLADRESLPELRGFLNDPRLRVRFDDGRHAIISGDARYDLIEADALLPYTTYAGNLYSVEFFKGCGARLKPGGFMCTWAPTARVKASFHAAFPHVLGPRDSSFLIGSNEPVAVEPQTWRDRLYASGVAGHLGAQRLDDIARPLARIRLVEDAPTDRPKNHDLYPRDELLAP